jgi:hypothetical protein
MREATKDFMKVLGFLATTFQGAEGSLRFGRLHCMRSVIAEIGGEPS